MTTHILHPDIHEYGLADDCPRCAEHAEHPLESLDQVNIGQLKFRIENRLPPRSANEKLAMDAISQRTED